MRVRADHHFDPRIEAVRDRLDLGAAEVHALVHVRKGIRLVLGPREHRSGWTCYRAGGNICYADTPTAINREHAILDADRCVAVNPSDTAPALIALDARW